MHTQPELNSREWSIETNTATHLY